MAILFTFRARARSASSHIPDDLPKKYIASHHDLSITPMMNGGLTSIMAVM
jgi:hypothetical protein